MYRSIFRTLLVWTFLAASTGLAQASDFYRVELLLFERVLGEREQLSDEPPPSLPDHGLPLWVNTGWTPDTGSEATIANESRAILETPEIVALPRNGLRLASVAESLREKQGYRVLALTGWDDELAPGFRSVPLVVELTTGEDRDRMIRGVLNLERRRYLHVDANLARLKATEPRFRVAPLPVPQMTYPGVDQAFGAMRFSGDFLNPEPRKQWVTETRLTELRRMRSEEIHYLDAPTFGLIVYFHPIRDGDSDTEESD